MAYACSHSSKSSIALCGDQTPRADERRRGTRHVLFCAVVHLTPYIASSIPKDVISRAKPFTLSKPMKMLALNHLFWVLSALVFRGHNGPNETIRPPRLSP